MKITLKIGVLVLLILFFVFLITNRFTEGLDMNPMSYSSSSPMGVSPQSCAGITPSWPLNSLGTVTTINPPSVITTPASTGTPSPTTLGITSSPSPKPY